MTKRYVYISYGLLLIWFALDMIGVSFGGKVLVTTSYSEDFIFFAVAIISLILFIFKENIGKWVMLFWLIGWGVTQFIFHELYTIIGGGESKIAYFDGTIKLISSDTRYIPDLYHIILHILIVISLICMIRYIRRNKQDVRKV